MTLVLTLSFVLIFMLALLEFFIITNIRLQRIWDCRKRLFLITSLFRGYTFLIVHVAEIFFKVRYLIFHCDIPNKCWLNVTSEVYTFMVALFSNYPTLAKLCWNITFCVISVKKETVYISNLRWSCQILEMSFMTLIKMVLCTIQQRVQIVAKDFMIIGAQRKMFTENNIINI